MILQPPKSTLSSSSAASDVYKRQHLQRAMMKYADRSVFLADSDKFEKSALLKLADVNEAVTFVTDSGLRKEILELYQENGIEMIRGEQKQ